MIYFSPNNPSPSSNNSFAEPRWKGFINGDAPGSGPFDWVLRANQGRGHTGVCQGSYCWARENWTRVRIGAAAAGKKWHAGYTQFLCKFVCSFIFYKWNWKIEAKGIDEWCQSVEMSMWEGSPVLGWWLLRGGKLSNFVSPIVSDGFQHKSNFGTSILRFLHKL